MALDPPPVAGSEVLANGPAPVRTRLRIRFEKAGDLRFVSHHDLMHCFERMFRRANLPVQATRGFNPRPRMVFAQSLALGLVGRGEVLDLHLEEPLAPELVQERLARHCPPGLSILDIRAVAANARMQVRRAGYAVRIPPERCTDLRARIADTLSTSSCWIERTRPNKRHLDLRPFICELQLHDTVLQMTLWITPQGAARPEEVLEILGAGDIVRAGAVIERTGLELHDEVSAADSNGPACLASVARPVTEPISANKASDASRIRAPESEAGKDSSSRPTALIPGPLSFES